MHIAITREVSRSIIHCELTHLARTPIDVERARMQHRQYEATLRMLGLAVLSLPEEASLADSVFVEDTALVLDECAVITRPGAASRQKETTTIAGVLAPYRTLFHIEAPARLDGGDILQVGRIIYVGMTSRSDTNAMEQLQDCLLAYGYKVQAVNVTGCLHLKSAVTLVAEDTLLINPAWVDKDVFQGVKIIEIEASEPYAANTVVIGSQIMYPTSFPKTEKRLKNAGMRLVTLDADELAKAEGALTCCSLIIRT